MKNKMVSIIIPVYNAEKYLDKCIKSLINQTYKNIEIILVNDGSTDNSYEICKNYELLDDRVKVINKKNGGVSSARNCALKIVNGEYVGFVDSDDYIDKNMYKNLIMNLEKSNADISICGVKTIDENDKVISKTSGKGIISFDTANFLKKIVTDDNIMPSIWNKVFKKDIIKDIYFDETRYVGEDLEWMLKIIQKYENLNFVFDSSNLYFYTYRKNSASKKNNDKQAIDVLEINKKCFEIAILKKDNLYGVCLYRILNKLNYILKNYTLTENIYRRILSEYKIYEKDFLKKMKINIFLKIKFLVKKILNRW